MAEQLNPGCSPVRSKGNRDIWCERYGECLDYVVGQDWDRWSCGKERVELILSGCESKQRKRKPKRLKREPKPKKGAKKMAEQTMSVEAVKGADAGTETPVRMCKDCGEEPAIITKAGKVIHGLGRECYKKKVRATRERLSEQKRMEAEAGRKDEEIPFTIGEVHFGPKLNLVIDLDAYPDVLPALEDSARVNIRSVEHQALAYVVAGLKSDGYGKEAA